MAAISQANAEKRVYHKVKSEEASEKHQDDLENKALIFKEKIINKMQATEHHEVTEIADSKAAKAAKFLAEQQRQALEKALYD